MVDFNLAAGTTAVYGPGWSHCNTSHLFFLFLTQLHKKPPTADLVHVMVEKGQNGPPSPNYPCGFCQNLVEMGGHLKQYR